MSYNPYKPISTASDELLPDAAIINGSSTDNVEVLTVVVSPETVKSPVTIKLPARFTFAPVKVAAVVVPDLIIKFPELLVRLAKVVPSSLRIILFEPAASNTMSVTASKVIPLPVILLITGSVNVLLVKVSVPVNETKLSLCKAVLNSAKEPVKVLSPKSIDLLVNVSVVAFPTSVSVAAGNVRVTVAVEAGPINLA